MLWQNNIDSFQGRISDVNSHGHVFRGLTVKSQTNNELSIVLRNIMNFAGIMYFAMWLTIWPIELFLRNDFFLPSRDSTLPINIHARFFLTNKHIFNHHYTIRTHLCRTCSWFSLNSPTFSALNNLIFDSWPYKEEKKNCLQHCNYTFCIKQERKKWKKKLLRIIERSTVI